MKAAHPFIFMVVHIGRTKREILGLTLPRCSIVSIVTGSVAAELFVNKAINTAGIIRENVFNGLIPRIKRNNGRTIKNWMAFPPKIIATYFPKDSITIPEVTCADNCAEKATIPKGNVHINPRINKKRSSCKPVKPFTTTCLDSDSGKRDNPKPTANAIRSSDSTFPSKNGRMMLLGMTESI